MMQELDAYRLVVCLLPLIGGSVAQLGSECSVNTDCTTGNSSCVIPYDSCLRGLCSCSEGFYKEQYTCREKRSIGESCELSNDCSSMTRGSYCALGVCECRNTQYHTFEDGMFQCYNAYAGEVCNRNEDCITFTIDSSLGRCNVFPSYDERKTCGCVNTHKLDGNKCVPMQYEEDCLISDTNQKMVCEGKLQCNDQHVCSCPEDTEYSHERGYCVHVESTSRGVRETCDTDPTLPNAEVCIGGLECDVCPEDEPLEYRCQGSSDGTVGAPGTICTTNADCLTANTHCLIQYPTCEGGTCECDAGYYRYQQTCRKKKSIGEQCTYITDCTTMTSGSTCGTSGMCECVHADYYAFMDEMWHCFNSYAGEICTQNEDCITHSIDPLLGRCDIFYDEDRKRCGCVNTHKLQGHQCVPVQHGEDCLTSNANETMVCDGELECNDQFVCTCPDNTEYSDEKGYCVHVYSRSRSIRETCDANPTQLNAEVCITGLECAVCPEDQPLEYRCQGTPDDDRAGAACSAETWCLAAYTDCWMPYPTCEQGTCECIVGYYSHQQTCRAKKRIDESCELDTDCTAITSGSYCSSIQMCQCEYTQQYLTFEAGMFRCYNAQAGETCTRSEDCITFSIDPLLGKCDVFDNNDGRKMCGCVKTHKLEGNQCVPVQHGENCQLGSSMDKMVCEGQLQCNDQYVCSCPEGTQFSYDRRYCVHLDHYDGYIGMVCDPDPTQPHATVCAGGLDCAVCPADSSHEYRCQGTPDYGSDSDDDSDEDDYGDEDGGVQTITVKCAMLLLTITALAENIA